MVLTYKVRAALSYTDVSICISVLRGHAWFVPNKVKEQEDRRQRIPPPSTKSSYPTLGTAFWARPLECGDPEG